MFENVISIPKKNKRKIKEKNIKDFEIDTTHYKVKSPKIIKTIDIKF